jgi:hypothetical protein
MVDYALLRKEIVMENKAIYASLMAILVMVMTFLKLFEHAIIVTLFCIFAQLVILNGKFK